MGEYMLLIWHDEAAWQAADEDAVHHIMLAHEQFTQHHSTAWRTGKRLRPSHTGSSIRAGVVTDGAFTETKEVLGGYYLIEAGDLDEAVAIAKHPSHAIRAHRGPPGLAGRGLLTNRTKLCGGSKTQRFPGVFEPPRTAVTARGPRRPRRRHRA